MYKYVDKENKDKVISLHYMFKIPKHSKHIKHFACTHLIKFILLLYISPIILLFYFIYTLQKSN